MEAAGAGCPASALTGELAALNQAMDLELKILRFYEAKAAESGTAGDEAARAFWRGMQQEARAHFVLLSETQFYYEDPENWAFGKGPTVTGSDPIA